MTTTLIDRYDPFSVEVPEAPSAGYILAEVADEIGLPPGVLNVVTADRETSELLVRDPRVDKIAFTGSTAAGRRIAALCGERVARYTLELGGKSAAVILDDADLEQAATAQAGAECFLTGQACSSLTRIIVERHRHDEFVDALAARFAAVRVGDPFDPGTQMGPLAMSRRRDRVEHYIEVGRRDGARLAVGGGRPAHLDRGWFVEPTVFAEVANASTLAQEEIFGSVLAVIPAADEADAVRLANDTVYGLNARRCSPPTPTGPARRRGSSGRERSGTTPSAPTSASGSAGSSSPGPAAKGESKVCVPTWRTNASSSTRCRPGSSRSTKPDPATRSVPQRSDREAQRRPPRSPCPSSPPSSPSPAPSRSSATPCASSSHTP